MKKRIRIYCFLSVVLVAFIAVPLLFAASHREAPLIALDPAADNTDVYAFVGYDQANLDRDPADRRVVFILNTIPGQEPGDGPNYFNFDDNVLYRIHIDNNQDGEAEDIVYEIQFTTETRPISGSLTFPLPYVGNPAISGLAGITALDGSGSEGLTRRQTYTVTEVRGIKGQIRTELFQGQRLVAVPSNVGPATMPNYGDLASQGIYADGDIRVFAGQRAETFYIDLGAVFDTLNLRRAVPALSQAEDANDAANPFGINRFSGSNINTIAIEIPITRLTSDGKQAADTKFPIIGMYASTSRRRIEIRGSDGQGRVIGKGRFVQVSRMANPLINELIIDTPFKDIWNASEPEDEAQFQEFFKNPSLALALNLIFSPVPPPPAPGRTDLMQLFLKYPGQPLAGTDCGSPCSELLRLDLRVEPTPAESQRRLGALATPPDPAGVPNGRRPNDDVTDIATRLVGGDFFIANRVGDGVNFLQDAPGIGFSDGPGYGSILNNRLDVTANGIAKEFPFLPTPHDGRNRQHIDCGEAGGNPCN